MTPTIVLPVMIGGLYAAGVYLLLDRSLTRVLLGFVLLGNATNLLLLSTGGPAGLAPGQKALFDAMSNAGRVY